MFPFAENRRESRDEPPIGPNTGRSAAIDAVKMRRAGPMKTGNSRMMRHPGWTSMESHGERAQSQRRVDDGKTGGGGSRYAKRAACISKQHPEPGSAGAVGEARHRKKRDSPARGTIEQGHGAWSIEANRGTKRFDPRPGQEALPDMDSWAIVILLAQGTRLVCWEYPWRN